ncbi:MAG: MAPEG family protein [Lysobacterales bacterium]
MVDARIFGPAFAMVALTAVVMARMLFERTRQMRAGRIHFRDIPSGSQMAARFADTRAADNYRNLFEMPVLFYLALVVAAIAGLVTPLSLGLAWAYVALRVVHSAIHCGYNRVMHRFYAFLASNLVLWALWAWLGWRLLGA